MRRCPLLCLCLATVLALPVAAQPAPAADTEPIAAPPDTWGDAIQVRYGQPLLGLMLSEPDIEGTLHVVFMGGSITTMGDAADTGWTRHVAAELQARYPERTFAFRNVGIPSIGSDGHAHRYARDVTAHGTPDLLFIEAAVNDRQMADHHTNPLRGMEGVVRAARGLGTEVVMLHFAAGDSLQACAEGETHPVIAAHERVAEHYGIPSIDYARHIANGIAAGDLDWRRDFNANVHVPPFGQRLYADGIAVLFDRLAAAGATEHATAVPDALLDPASYTHGQLLPVTDATPRNGSTITDDWAPADGKATRAGFVHVPVLEAIGAGSGFVFDFVGIGAGIWVIAGPDAARFHWRVDGGDWHEEDAYTRWSGGLHLPWVMVLAGGLNDAEHTLDVHVLARPADQPGGEALRVVHLLEHGHVPCGRLRSSN